LTHASSWEKHGVKANTGRAADESGNKKHRGQARLATVFPISELQFHGRGLRQTAARYSGL